MNNAARQSSAKATTLDLDRDRLSFATSKQSERTCEELPRLSVKGKFLFLGDKKFYIKGATYGTFAPNALEEQFPAVESVDRDFEQMALQGLNSVRVYTVPPIWLLDLAQKHGLRVMAGLPWEQHITFLDEKQLIDDIKQRVRAGVRACSQHPALLCFAIGNEIPASIVRWYGPQRVEEFLKLLYWTVKLEDPESLVTYVNFPSTEYLQTPFVDFYCFNVYLETQEKLLAYLARLQNLVEDKPLVMAEIGLDSQRNGEIAQAEILTWQIQTIFAAGCAGCFVFAWTDEWYRGGFEIEDWDFGLVRRSRQPKPALDAVSTIFAETPIPTDITWPRISVAVCSYNGSRTLRDTLEGLKTLDYPDFETIFVDDGSTDNVADIARKYEDIRVIVHPQNQGLSAARNTALAAATGEIIAYIDDDAYPDPHWLTYLASTFLNGEWAGVGGPNLPPVGDGPVADCVANAPGGPVHVLISDQEAEHIPGCNMAYWVDRLRAIEGFDVRYRSAGDDVDVCWRLQEQGWKLGFSPAAVVWHHRRNSIRTYWKQQQGYGKAEALLEEKWPEKYNTVGHLSWAGRLYGKGQLRMLPLQKQRIYQGTWGSALFQSIYEPAPGLLSALPTMPEWYLLALLPAGLSLLGLVWDPGLWALPVFVLMVGMPIGQAVWSARQAKFITPGLSKFERIRLYAITSLLYCMQPLARLWGRLDNGLTPWRRRYQGGFRWPAPFVRNLWSETWGASEQRLMAVCEHLDRQGAIAVHGGDFDPWDLEVRGGLSGVAHMIMAIEEHGSGKQLIRFRVAPKVAPVAIAIILSLILLMVYALIDQSLIAVGVLGGVTLSFVVVLLQDCGVATAACFKVIEQMATTEDYKPIL